MTTPQAGGRRPVFRWIVLALIVLVLAAAILLPLVNLSRYHRTIAESLSRSLGRPVHLGSVQLQVFPRPGLALTDFEVEETPAFGAEPVLRAPSVVVSFRFSSLWKGRLEVSRIDLDNASMNLVHNSQGDWNIGSLLLDASRNQQASTSQHHASSTLRFPYIEFRSARVNLKDGNEKKPFAFLNSDLSIWLDKPTQWSLRMEAQPARTDLDLDLSDTGTVKIDGTINRATSINQMPVNLRAEWTGAQLGQVSRLLLGDDSGWRGDLRAEATLSGLLNALNVQTRLRVDNAHREEFTPDTPMNIDARCRGIYSHSNRSIDNMTCLWPVGDGHLLLTGNVTNFSHPQSHLSLELNQIPAAFAVNALGLLRRGMTTLPKAAGIVNGSFSAEAGDSPLAITGRTEVSNLTLALPGIDTPLRFPAIELTTAIPAAPSASRGQKHPHAVAAPAPSTGFNLQLLPVALNMDAPRPLTISGQFGKEFFSVRASGETTLARLQAFSKLTGRAGVALANLAPESATATEPAEMDLTFSAPWIAQMKPDEAQAGSQALGWLRVSHAVARTPWLPEPIHVATATANFTPGTVAWSNLNFSVNGIAARGNISYPLQCAAENGCPARFALESQAVDAATLEANLLGTVGHGELVNAILSEVKRQTAPWPAAEGTLSIGRLTLDQLVMTNVRSTLSIRPNRVQFVSVDGMALGGSLHAGGVADSASGTPQYALNLTWTGVDPAKAAAIFDENWGSGSLSGDAQVAFAGVSTDDFARSAKGSFHWSWIDGSLGAGAYASTKAPADQQASDSSDADSLSFSPRHFAQWSAAGTISGQALHLSGSGAVKGQIDFDRSLDLNWPTENGRLRVEGKLGQPSVAVQN
ncbi:AsmA family protein [Silvibacterium acidisoli]|uniref:AsmA family protein n=1 Tax=Acidobacteriaceae bacterium ZG23-2 TaxID=2883246 RepID=UPI00406D2E21